MCSRLHGVILLEDKPIESAYGQFRAEQIVGACDKLLKDMSFEELTVKDIVEVLGISRPTFYRYFTDKYEIAQWFWDSTGEQYLKECGRSLDWYESSRLMIRSFMKYPTFSTKSVIVSGEKDVNAVINHGYRKRISYLEDVIQELNPVLLTDDLKFQIEFFTDAESRAIAHWMSDGLPQSPEQLSRRIVACVPHELYDLIDRAHREYVSK